MFHDEIKFQTFNSLNKIVNMVIDVNRRKNVLHILKEKKYIYIYISLQKYCDLARILVRIAC